MVIGNALSGRDTIPDYVNELTGLYFDAASGYPALNLFVDTLPRSKIKLLTALSLADNALYVLKPSEDNTFIIQGMGRGAQETVYFTGDTVNYGGYKFVKAPPVPGLAIRARSAVPDTIAKSSAKLAAPEDVVDNLKKALKKSTLF